MTTTIIMDETYEQNPIISKPGSQLGTLRIERGLTQEYVAGKLNLRIHLIELLEADEYDSMPQAVFIKGYLRAYAKLLGVPADPLLISFNQSYTTENKSEKTLWQSKREKNKAEYAIRWITGFFALIVLFSVIMWWYTNKENQAFIKSTINHPETASNKAESDIRLTDLSKMRSLLSSQSQIETYTPLEK